MDDTHFDQSFKTKLIIMLQMKLIVEEFREIDSLFFQPYYNIENCCGSKKGTLLRCFFYNELQIFVETGKDLCENDEDVFWVHLR